MGILPQYNPVTEQLVIYHRIITITHWVQYGVEKNKSLIIV